jgi:hypothetical protein
VSGTQETAIAVSLAVATAVVLAALGYPWKLHRHQLRWTPRAPQVGLAGYLLLFGVAAGVLGWGFGAWSGWEPANVVARGVLWGSFGAAVLRAQFDRLPQPTLAGPAISAAGLAGGVIAGAVAARVEEAVEEELADLSNEQLALYVLELLEGGVKPDTRLSELDRKHFEQQVNEASVAIDGSDEAERREEIAFLRQSGKR